MYHSVVKMAEHRHAHVHLMLFFFVFSGVVSLVQICDLPYSLTFIYSSNT